MKIFYFFIFIFSFASCEETIEKNTKVISETLNKVRSFAFVNADSIQFYNNRLHKILNKNIASEVALLKYCDAVYYLTIGQHTKASTNFTEAAAVFQKEKNDSLLFYSYIALGNCNKLSGDIDEAIRYFLKALPANETTKNKKNFTICYGNLAETYQQKNDVTNAKKYLQLTKANEDYGSRTYVAMMHLEANLYGMANLLDSALITDYEGIRLATQYTYSEKLTPFYDNIAQCYILRKNYDSAAYYFDKCIYIDSINGRVQLIADTYSQLVNLYALKNDHQKMIATFLYADSLCDNTQYLRGKYRIYEALNGYHERNKNLQKLKIPCSIYIDE